MINPIKYVQLTETFCTQQYFLLLAQVTLLSGIVIMLFDALWSATVFLPLSVGAEIIAKLLISHCIKHWIHHRGR